MSDVRYANTERDNIRCCRGLSSRDVVETVTRDLEALSVEQLPWPLSSPGGARLGFNWDLPAFLVLLAGLYALASVDAEKLVLPKRIVYPTLLMVVGCSRWTPDHRLVAPTSLSRAVRAGLWIVFFALHAASPRLLGFGECASHRCSDWRWLARVRYVCWASSRRSDWRDLWTRAHLDETECHRRDQIP